LSFETPAKKIFVNLGLRCKEGYPSQGWLSIAKQKFHRKAEVPLQSWHLIALDLSAKPA
jgi:hypothetical protein